MDRIHPIYDVVIAGAGPVGLFLANELLIAGVSVLVLEKAKDPGSSLKKLPFGMRGLSAPSLEAFYRRGMLDEISMPSVTPKSDVGRDVSAAHWSHQSRRPAGHFAGIQFFHDMIDEQRWSHRLAGSAGTHLATTMEQVETVLSARLEVKGIEILFDHQVDDLQPSADGVTLTAGGSTFRGRWLVGCDGGRSMVRRLGGFEFVGTDPEFTGYSALVEMEDPDRLRVGRHYTETGMYTYQKPGTIAMVDFDGGASHRTQPLTLDHVQSVLCHVCRMDITLKALRLAATWTDRAYQTTAYRSGRIVLAGDAAHIHSPLGGQGLNLGLGDAMNLGWKLAATVLGTAPGGLLDSYTHERHPVGAQVLDWSRAQVALMRPSRSSRALEAIVRDLIETSDGATYFAERVWGTCLRYDLGSTDPLVGASAPDFEFEDGSRPGDHLRKGKGLVVDFGAGLLRRCDLEGEVEYIRSGVKDRLGLSALLVRPDGVVAWVARTATDFQEFEQAAGKWFRFGTP
ncbi:FAD-dependent monooxygenase [Rhizobium sp. CC-YZS058]|uniref:FAD-dependent monooxygenase n=1 Tax=Rhizobium sp. CC-YZS058 TaxID=3042153 RepID=UPI002B057DD2|nr:FAD-dependent monooxygenase [Rhizobium sp. CC-YZS058]MEA3537023.1 FAD-dependent monooxygenase [Rhizobium sp. CC-YZS058]